MSEWQDARDKSTISRITYEDFLGETGMDYVARSCAAGLSKSEMKKYIETEMLKYKNSVSELQFAITTMSMSMEKLLENIAITVSSNYCQYFCDLNASKKSKKLVSIYGKNIDMKLKGKSYIFNFARVDEDLIFWCAVAIVENSKKFDYENIKVVCRRLQLVFKSKKTKRLPLSKYLQTLCNEYLDFHKMKKERK